MGDITNMSSYQGGFDDERARLFETIEKLNKNLGDKQVEAIQLRAALQQIDQLGYSDLVEGVHNDIIDQVLGQKPWRERMAEEDAAREQPDQGMAKPTPWGSTTLEKGG